ncbi:hypothetical protein HN903_01280 [archaeon]|jgi:hypothetical protein|nr:hypothetical protein [archaeon]MBT7128364.1 hypothetical protein [archaeon]
MKSNMKNVGMDIKEKLSLLWIFLLFNYLYCDYLGMFDAGILAEIMGGTVGGMVIGPMFLISAAIFMEIPIAMILLSRFLKRRVNRVFNIVAGLIMIAGQLGSLFVGEPALYYSVYSVLEVLTLVYIVWVAWSWPQNGMTLVGPKR